MAIDLGGESQSTVGAGQAFTELFVLRSKLGDALVGQLKPSPQRMIGGVDCQAGWGRWWDRTEFFQAGYDIGLAIKPGSGNTRGPGQFWCSFIHAASLRPGACSILMASPWTLIFVAFSQCRRIVASFKRA